MDPRAKRARTRGKTSPFSKATGTESLQVEAHVEMPCLDLSESVVALIESRSREVGLAGVHCRSMDFELTQFSDTAAYSRTISAVLAADPAVVLVTRSARGTQLVQMLEEILCQTLHFIERRQFDEAEGQALLEEATVVGLQQADYASKFAAAASFHALWRYVESSNDLSLLSSSCKVTYRVASDICVVDSSTARLLELVSSTRRSTILSLFSTRTSQGSQLLRQALLQPSAQVEEIQKRQDGIEALLQNRRLERVQQLLPSLGDLDVLVARLSAEPRQRGMAWYKLAVRTALRLRQALASLPLLAQAISGAEALQALAEALSSGIFGEQLGELERVLDQGLPGRGSMAQAALIYAVKPNVSSLLDVARQTWTEALEQIHDLHRNLSSKYPELQIRLEFAEKKGWYLSHARGSAPELLQTMPRGERMSSSTKELNSENFKLRQAEAEILRRNVEVLAELFQGLRKEFMQLHDAAEAVALLDVLCALAGYARVSGAVRPELVVEGPVALRGARHPLLERLEEFHPVDYFLGEGCDFQVITGHNGGGKSTYLQTLAQLVILAQIGCWVPAQSCQLRICSSIFTRMGSSDCIEASASSFLVEMKEAAHILNSLSSKSLVLIDELGRGTAHADGLAICWAFCEKLLELQVPCLFATHYFELCRLQETYHRLRNMHLEHLEEEGVRRFAVQHISSLKALDLKAASRYGLQAALSNGIPKVLVQRAEEMVVKVDEAFKLCEGEVETLRQLEALSRRGHAPPMLSEILRELQKPWLPRASAEGTSS